MNKSLSLSYQNRQFLLILVALAIIFTSFSCKSSKSQKAMAKDNLEATPTKLTSSARDNANSNSVDIPPRPTTTSRQEILRANAHKIPVIDKPSGIVQSGENYYETVEFPAVPPGGLDGWMQYLSSNLNYPELAMKNKISGTVIAMFIVTKDGSISDVEILRGIGGGCDEETVRVIKNSPTWTAGKLKSGEAVNTRMRLPVRFN